MDLFSANVPLSSIMRAHVDRSGWLNQLSTNGIRKQWKRRFFVLRGNRLFYFKSDKPDEPVAGMVVLDHYAAIERDASYKKAIAFRLDPVKSTQPASACTTSTPSFFKMGHPVQTGAKTLFIACDTEDELFLWMENIRNTLMVQVPPSASVLESTLAKLDFEKYRKRPKDVRVPSLKVRNSEESMDSVTYAASVTSTGTAASSVRSKSPDAEDRDLLYPIAKSRFGYRGQLATQGAKKWQELSRRRSSPYLNSYGPAATTSPLAQSSQLDQADSGYYEEDHLRSRAATLNRPSFSDLSPMSRSSTLFPELDDFRAICPQDREPGETYFTLIHHEMETGEGRRMYR
jgi:hypothetical protein